MSIFREHTDKILTKIPKHRLLAIDAFRGIAITGMILVNNPGSWSHIYAPLKHAQWHGWTPTDLIFPFFIFIVGISISFSIGRQISQKTSRQNIITSSAIRMTKLILLGWFLALFYYRFGDADYNWLENRLYVMRYMGVLQRIGIVYFATALLFIFSKPKALIFWTISLLLAYGLLMNLVPYESAKGEIYQGLWTKGNNLSAWLDHNLLGINHVYSKTTPFSFDPEGLLSTIPAISTCLTGVLVGLYLQQPNSKILQIKTLSILGFLAIVAGQILEQWIPINKVLWTPSYVLLSTGFACLTYGLCSYLLDIKKLKSWSAPLIVFGANSIAFFMFSGIVGRLLVIIPVEDMPIKAWIYNNIYLTSFGPTNGSLMFAISFLIVSYLVMHWMYRKNIFWKV